MVAHGNAAHPDSVQPGDGSFIFLEHRVCLCLICNNNRKQKKSKEQVLDSSGVSSEGINHLPYMNALLMQRLSTFRDTLNANFLTRNLFTCRTGLPAVHICPLNECLLKENNHQTAADD